MPLPSPPTPLLLAIVAVSYLGGGVQRYLLPLVTELDHTAVAVAGEFRIADPQGGATLREPRDGEGAWAALAELVTRGVDLQGARGTFRFTPGRGRVREAASTRGERRLTGEQSHTSVVIGETLFLKCYRRLDEGLNPEVEILDFLDRHAFDRTPALLGSATYQPGGSQPSGIAILQELVIGGRDAWESTLELARTWISSGGRAPERERTETSAVGIGSLTGRLHATLASDPTDPRFPVRSATDDERRGWHASALRQLEGAVGAVSAADGQSLRSLEAAVRRALAPLADSRADRTVIRTHGDFHLGQLLQRGDGFLVVDFEGEPARPLAERRVPQSPLKDVAGMLRSFDYAARTVEGIGGRDVAGGWLGAMRRRFLDAYRASVAGSGITPEIDADLLRAFEVEKACYEIRYEAANRPDWVWLPIAGLRTLTGA